MARQEPGLLLNYPGQSGDFEVPRGSKTPGRQPIIQSVTKSGTGTVYLDHDPGGGTPKVSKITRWPP